MLSVLDDEVTHFTAGAGIEFDSSPVDILDLKSAFLHQLLQEHRHLLVHCVHHHRPPRTRKGDIEETPLFCEQV
ncbi:hypothetical protein ALO90_200085 [Pseudomonas amygdali pv. aesculi]|nr:hypothetical protein ALO90_200085 [Pseudomonas amygdali pv. aesculi]